MALKKPEKAAAVRPRDEGTVHARLARLEAALAEPKTIEKIQKDKDKEIEKRQKDKEIEKVQKDKDKEIEKIQKDKDKDKEIEKIQKDKDKEIEKVQKDKDKEIEKIQKDKDHLEKVNIKAENEKFHWKEWKPEKVEGKEAFPEKDWSETKLTEVPTGSPEAQGTVEERLARLEAAVFTLSHFIGVDLRPDLSGGALKQEPEAGGGAPATPKEPDAAAGTAKRRPRTRKNQV